MFFGLMNTSFGAYDFDRFLILFVGSRPGLREQAQAASESVWYKNHVG